MVTTKIRIKDTGLNKVGGSVIYNKVSAGAWIDLSAQRINYEFNTKTTNNEAAGLVDGNGDMTFSANEVTTIIPPRFTIENYVLASDAQTLSDMIMLGRTQGIKRLSGGMGIISALPEKLVDTYDYISVIVKNITPREVLMNSTDYIVFTIQLEQVQ